MSAEQAAADRLRLLHQDDADHRSREDVEAGERDQLLLDVWAELVVLRRDLGEDDRELAVRDERDPRVQALPACEAPAEPRGEAAADLADDRDGHGRGEQPADLADRADVDREPEDEEEQRREDVAEAEEALLQVLAHGRPRQDDAGHQRADRLGEPELLGDRGHADEERECAEQEELARQPLEHQVERPAQPLRRGERQRDEAERLADERQRRGERAAAAAREAEHEGDREVLGHEDREHEVGLVVGEAPEVDQPLHGDRARRDVDRAGEDQRPEVEPEGGDADGEAEPHVQHEVDAAADDRVPAAAREAAERELEAEEEEQEHDPELSDELGHLGRVDQAEDLRLVRPEQQAGEQVRGDRREAEAVRDETKQTERRDRDGELGEGHLGD